MKRDNSTIWFVALAVSVVVALVVVMRRRQSHQAEEPGRSGEDISSDAVLDGSGKDSFPASDPPATY